MRHLGAETVTVSASLAAAAVAARPRIGLVMAVAPDCAVSQSPCHGIRHI
jgi:hypothetical protein